MPTQFRSASLETPVTMCAPPLSSIGWRAASAIDEPEIGDVDEGVVEGGEDTSNAENELTCDGGVCQ